MPAQTAGDLRTLVARRAGAGRRVALLSSDAALAGAVEGNGCTLLVDPPSLDELGAFRPDVVVAFDGFAQNDAAAAFRLLAAAAPDAELVFSFASAASASALLRGLTGHPVPPRLAEAEVQRALASAGWAVTARDVVVTAPAPTGLSADTEVALRQLLEQVNPDAAADRLLLVARRGALATPPGRTPGLLSVVVAASGDVPALEGTLASLAAQARRPLELLVASALPPDVLDRALEKPRARAHLTARAVHSDAADFAGRTNAGLTQARGQYLAFLEAGDLVAPTHFAALVKRLEAGTAAWALGVCRAGGVTPALPARFALDAWLRAGAVERCAFVLDRERLGPVPLTFAEGVPAPQALYLARLAALFPPAFSPGAPGVERAAASAEPVATLVDALRGRPLRALTTLEELLREPPRPQLAELVKEELDARSPAAARAFGAAEGLVRRVVRAAKRELEKK